MDKTTLSRVNLNAVFRTLEKLVELDPKSADIIAGADEVLQFTSPAATIRLAIKDGKITFHRGSGPNTMNLAFPTPGAVNKLFEGTGIPIPLKGITKIGFLTGTFTELTERMTEILQPSEEALKDDDFRELNTILTVHVAVYALAEIANSDELGKMSAARIPDGEIQLAVKNGPALIIKINDHKFSVVEGVTTTAMSRMIFEDIETTGQVLRGDLPSYTAVGRDLISLSGNISNLDNFNKILALVSTYL